MPPIIAARFCRLHLLIMYLGAMLQDQAAVIDDLRDYMMHSV